MDASKSRAGARDPVPHGRRPGWAAIVAAGALLAACQTGTSAGGRDGTSAGEPAGAAAPVAAVAELPSAARITVSPGDGSGRVQPSTDIRVRARGGRLVEVSVLDERGRSVHGRFDEGRQAWTSRRPLALASRYNVVARAADPDGRKALRITSFRTVKPERYLDAAVAPLSGEVVGVGMPIAVSFDHAVSDRAAVESRLRVRTSVPVQGAWHWLSDTEVHYRPRTYWPAGTHVSLHADLAGVRVGRGTWGAQDEDVSFDVGRALVSTVDVSNLTMTVRENGRVLATIPITSGKPGFETRGGVKVVLEKIRALVMDSTTIGIQKGDPDYYRLDVEYAVRVTWSGEFLHSAPWSLQSQGRENVSHGCVGMSPGNAAWFYDRSIRGDVVDVVGSARPMELTNGFGDWNLSWRDWKAGSALRS